MYASTAYRLPSTVLASKVLKLLGGIGLLFISVFMLIGVLAGGGKDHGLFVDIFVFGLAVVLPGVAGLTLLRQHLRRSLPSGAGGADALRRQTWESEILKLAERKGGRLTVVEVVADTVIGAEDAEETLGILVGRGMAEPEVTEGGLIVYRFPDVQLLKDKNSLVVVEPYQDGGHGFISEKTGTIDYQLVLDAKDKALVFLERHLKGTAKKTTP